MCVPFSIQSPRWVMTFLITNSHFGAAAIHIASLIVLHSSQSAWNLSRYCSVGTGVVQIVGVQGATYGHAGHGGFLPYCL
jgi:hypothetical protein